MSTSTNNKKSKKVVEEEHDMLDDISHALLRPDMYIGSVEASMLPMWIYNEDVQKFTKSDIQFSPGLYKIFDEIMVNAYDHTIRTKDCKTIKVEFDKITGKISVWNDGPGVPVKINEKHNIYVPEMIFGHFRSSSNYKDDGKIVGGRNGFGAKLTNVFSTEFVLETIDSINKKSYIQTFTNNMRDKTKPIVNDTTKESYTKISFIPEYNRFGYKGLTSDTISLFSKRVYDLAICTNKNVNVYLNGEKITCKDFPKYVKMYYETEPKSLTLLECGPRWKLGAIFDNNAGATNISFVNGICTYNGVTHVKYITDQICDGIIEIIKKKNKDLNIKSDAIKLNITLFLICSIEDPTFNSQVKDKLNRINFITTNKNI